MTTAGDDRVRDGYLVTLSGRAWGLSLALLFGLLLFLATNILVIKGGPNVGEHLGLLSEYLPFYDVTFIGSLIGFAYAFVIGWVLGRVIAFLYGLAARRLIHS